MCQLQPILHKQHSSNYLRNNTGKKFRLKYIRLTTNLASFQSKESNIRVKSRSKTENLTEAMKIAHIPFLAKTVAFSQQLKCQKEIIRIGSFGGRCSMSLEENKTIISAR